MNEVRRVALWGLIVAKVIGGWGLTWDIQWHVAIGRDSFWIAPHLMIYASVTGAFVLAFGVLVLDTFGPSGRTGGRALRILGFSSSHGFHLAAWGIAVVLLAAPIDDLWHRLFGLDVTLWSPPHLLGLLGSATNTLGCLLIAREVYPGRSRVGLAGLLVAGALFYGGLRITLDPAYLLAYNYGGVLFHAYSILAALILPLALVPTTRLSGLRWAPLFVMVIAIVLGLSGELVAQVGFAVVQPVSVIDEEIAKDPTSPIATANAINQKNRGTRPAWARLIPLVPVAAMAAVDPTLRPVGATFAYAVAVFAISGWYLAGRPAFQPMVPGPMDTAFALALTLAAALAGAILARWLSDVLEPSRVPDLDTPLPRPVS